MRHTFFDITNPTASFQAIHGHKSPVELKARLKEIVAALSGGDPGAGCEDTCEAMHILNALGDNL